MKDGDKSSLKSRSVRAVAWNAGGNVIQQLTLIATMIILARILSPEEFGIYALLMVFVSFSQILAQMGTSSAVIYFDDLSERFLSTAFFFSIVASSLVYLVLLGLSAPLASFMNAPALTGLLRLIGLVLIINSLGLIHKALLEKKLDFKKLILVEKVALIFSSAAGVVAAMNGFGAMSFVLMALLLSTLQLIGFTACSRWRPRLMFGLAEVRRMLSYSLNLLGFTIINYFARQSDHFLVGKFLGSNALGVYSVAYRIMLYPLENVSRVLIRVLFPAFSEVKHDNARFKRGYVQAISFIALVTFPLMFGLLVLADLFVAVVFGEDWAELAPLLMILALVGLQQSIVTTVGSIYLAKGTTSLMFRVGGLNALIIVISFLTGVWFGIIGMTIAYLVANLLMLYPNLYFAWRQIDLGVLEGIGELGIFFMAAIAMSIAVMALGASTMVGALPELPRLTLLVGSGGAAYVFLLLIFARKRVLSLIALFRTRRVDQIASTV